MAERRSRKVRQHLSQNAQLQGAAVWGVPFQGEHGGQMLVKACCFSAHATCCREDDGIYKGGIAKFEKPLHYN